MVEECGNENMAHITPALLATLAYLAGLTLNRRRTNFGTQ